MKQIRLILIAAFAASSFAVADMPKSLEGLLRVNADVALTKNGERPSTREVDDAIREVSDLLHFNADALAEFEAMTQNESGGSAAVSAVALQEVMKDYESLAKGRAIPILISFYLAKSKTEVLPQRERVLCYVMIKSAIRNIRATEENK